MWEVRREDQWDGEIVNVLFSIHEHLSSLPSAPPCPPTLSLFPSPSLPSPSLLFLPLGSNRQSMLSLNSGSQEFDTASLRDDMISVTSESPKRCIVLYSYKVSAVLRDNFLHSELYLFNACIH